MNRGALLTLAQPAAHVYGKSKDVVKVVTYSTSYFDGVTLCSPIIFGVTGRLTVVVIAIIFGGATVDRVGRNENVKLEVVDTQ